MILGFSVWVRTHYSCVSDTTVTEKVETGKGFIS